MSRQQDNGIKWALFIYDQYSVQGPGFRVNQMSREQYAVEVRAIEYLNRTDRKDASYSTLLDSRAEAYQLAKDCLGQKIWDQLF